MKKKILIVLLAVVVEFLIIIGVTKYTQGVSFKCIQADQSEGHFYIDNRSWLTYSCGIDDYEIEFYNDNKWESLANVIPVISYPVMYEIKPFNKMKININFEQSYGIFKSGKYRIAKVLTRKNDGQKVKLYYEFEIE